MSSFLGSISLAEFSGATRIFCSESTGLHTRVAVYWLGLVEGIEGWEATNSGLKDEFDPGIIYLPESSVQHEINWISFLNFSIYVSVIKEPPPHVDWVRRNK